MRLLSAVTACALLLPGVVSAQDPASGPPPAPASAVTVGFMHAIHATNELEQTLAFYRDVFGLSGQVRDFANHAVPILTASGAPASVKLPLGEVKAIFFRDPDGYIVEAIQVPAAADAPAGNVVGSIMGLTVRDLDESLRFWQDQLGWTFAGDKSFARVPAMLDLMGLPAGSEYRTMTGVVPGSRARIEITEFKGMTRKPFATLRNVFVKDPNGLNVELVGEPSR